MFFFMYMVSSCGCILREKYFIMFVPVAHHRTLPQAWRSLCNCYKLRYFCFRLHDWYDPASLRTHSLPHQQFVRQESPCEGHHLLDTQPILPLGCESAPWQLSEATHDRSMWLTDEVESSETVIITNCLEFHSSSRRYSPGWALASSTVSLHCCLSFVFSIHCFIFITFKSATSSSIYPSISSEVFLFFFLWTFASSLVLTLS